MVPHGLVQVWHPPQKYVRHFGIVVAKKGIKVTFNGMTSVFTNRFESLGRGTDGQT